MVSLGPCHFLVCQAAQGAKGGAKCRRVGVGADVPSPQAAETGETRISIQPMAI